MSPEEKSLLERTYRIAEENNEILRSIRRSTRFSMLIKVSYWAVIILLSLGAYYFIEPYLNVLKGIYTGSPATTTSTNNTNDISNISELLKSL